MTVFIFTQYLYCQVFNHSKRFQGDTHRFSATSDPLDSLSEVYIHTYIETPIYTVLHVFWRMEFLSMNIIHVYFIYLFIYLFIIYIYIYIYICII